MSQFFDQFRAARRAATPLVCVRTADQASAVAEIAAQNPKAPVLVWDILKGIRGVNATGQGEAATILQGRDAAEASGSPPEALVILEKIEQPAIILFWHAPTYFRGESGAATLQGIMNLREPFKFRGAMLVLLGNPGAILPPELKEHVTVLDMPLPTPEELEKISQAVLEVVKLKVDAPEMARIIDALAGLSAFAAEQCLAMSLTTKGVDLPALWERKKQTIEQTPGLGVWREGQKFQDIGGCENIKAYLSRIIKGKQPPRAVVFIDEIEKAIAGTGTDLSGVKTEMSGTLLTWMQDKRARGAIFIGPPGAAKSAMAKALGNEAGVPTVCFDLAAMQSSLVGSSGERLRAALAVVDTVAQGRAFFVATCNSIGALPPELRRRFKRGIFFFDLPDEDERALIWKIYRERYAIPADDPKPNDHGWTGAEIEQCAEMADELNMTLAESATYVVPVAVSASEQIKKLRQDASGKFISASIPGLYRYSELNFTEQMQSTRRLDALTLDQKGGAA